MCVIIFGENHIKEIFVNAFQTSQCGSSLGQDEKSDQETSLNRSGQLQLVIGKMASLTRIGKKYFNF